MLHEENSFWEGARRVERLEMVMDSEDMKLYVSDGKVQKERGLAGRSC